MHSNIDQEKHQPSSPFVSRCPDSAVAAWLFETSTDTADDHDSHNWGYARAVCRPYQAQWTSDNTSHPAASHTPVRQGAPPEVLHQKPPVWY